MTTTTKVTLPTIGHNSVATSAGSFRSEEWNNLLYLAQTGDMDAFNEMYAWLVQLGKNAAERATSAESRLKEDIQAGKGRRATDPNVFKMRYALNLYRRLDTIAKLLKKHVEQGNLKTLPEYAELEAHGVTEEAYLAGTMSLLDLVQVVECSYGFAKNSYAGLQGIAEHVAGYATLEPVMDGFELKFANKSIILDGQQAHFLIASPILGTFQDAPYTRECIMEPSSVPGPKQPFTFNGHTMVIAAKKGKNALRDIHGEMHDLPKFRLSLLNKTFRILFNTRAWMLYGQASNEYTKQKYTDAARLMEKCFGTMEHYIENLVEFHFYDIHSWYDKKPAAVKPEFFGVGRRLMTLTPESLGSLEAFTEAFPLWNELTTSVKTRSEFIAQVRELEAAEAKVAKTQQQPETVAPVLVKKEVKEQKEQEEVLVEPYEIGDAMDKWNGIIAEIDAVLE